MFYPRIVYQVKYGKDLKALFSTWTLPTDREHTDSLIHTENVGNFTTFKTFLQDHSSTFTWNKNTLQSPLSRVCGQYFLFYALHRSCNILMSTIVNMFTDHKVRNFIHKWYFV